MCRHSSRSNNEVLINRKENGIVSHHPLSQFTCRRAVRSSVLCTALRTHSGVLSMKIVAECCTQCSHQKISRQLESKGVQSAPLQMPGYKLAASQIQHHYFS